MPKLGQTGATILGVVALVWTGLSQPLWKVVKIPGKAGISGIINHLKSETERKEFVLPADSPLARKAEALSLTTASPRNRQSFASPWRMIGSRRSSACSSSRENARFQCLAANVWRRDAAHRTAPGPLSLRRRWPWDRRSRHPSRFCPAPAVNGCSFNALRKNLFAASRSRLAVSRKSTGTPCLSIAR
jgi:hypothetical protein